MSTKHTETERENALRIWFTSAQQYRETKPEPLSLEDEYALQREVKRLREALGKAALFVEEELECRQRSFMPEESPYISAAQATLDVINAALQPDADAEVGR